MKKDPVVASLPGPRFSHPYSSIAASPDRSHVVVAGKDTLRICSLGIHGLKELHSIRVAKYFRASSTSSSDHNPNQKSQTHNQATSSTNNTKNSTFDLRNFQHSVRSHHHSSDASQGGVGGGRGLTVTITDVAWSHGNHGGGSGGNNVGGKTVDNSSLPVGGGVGGELDKNNLMLDSHHGRNVGGSYSLNETNHSNSAPNIIIGGTNQHNSPQPSLNAINVGIEDDSNSIGNNTINDDSIVAAAGSNGVVVAWHAQTALLLDEIGSGNSAGGAPGMGSSWSLGNEKFDAAAAVIGQPEAVLAEHTRAVNRLAWHSKQHDLLLTASQDSTVKLWDRRTRGASSETTKAPQNPFESWFGLQIGSNTPIKSTPRRSIPSWYCATTFQPKFEAVRDVKWSPFLDEAFAVVTDSGILAIYDMRVAARPWMKIPAHDREATTVDWHPTRPYTIATGGGRDRSVKIWDVQSGLSTESGDFMRHRSDSGDLSENLRTVSSLPEKHSSSYYGVNSQSTPPTFQSMANRHASSNALSTGNQGIPSSISNTFTRFPFKGSQVLKRRSILSISSPITRVQWRPPNVSNTFSITPNDEENIDHHDAMLAVATAPISGTNYGGAGSLELWSYHRPFMALSIVEGHQDGAVTDFLWLDIPSTIKKKRRKSGENWGGASVGAGSDLSESPNLNLNLSMHMNMNLNHEDGSVDFSSMLENPSRAKMFAFDHPVGTLAKSERSSSFSGSSGANLENFFEDYFNTQGTWQHVLSVGRDGRCLLQNLERGGRPISQVPKCTFALANLSPFQSGSGSLQIMSVHQNVPSGQQNDFALTRLRRDAGTARAPGVFAEVPEILDGDPNKKLWRPKRGGQREPSISPNLVFSVIDPGDLDEPIPSNEAQDGNSIPVAPELVHVSRFAKSYRFRQDTSFPTRASLCIHNGDVAERWFGYGSLARMWKLLASILDGVDFKNLNEMKKQNMGSPKNVMSFLLFPTIKNLLLERANAGDVQTCVAICEVVGVFLPQNDRENSPQETNNTTAIPDLPASLVREWYLSYIEILHQMCLFSQASELIRTCQDPQVAALNKQSTNIHMSCPSCGKPLEDAVEKSDGQNQNLLPIAQRACRSCRRRIGMCFVCHTPVKGVYVYCPGCGHGGHLEHALEWFGGIKGSPVQEVCPTGCGHKCNRLREISAFPKTKSWIGCVLAD